MLLALSANCSLQLVQANSSGLATTGFDLWDHIGLLNDHERSFQHMYRESLSKYAIRLAKCETIDRCRYSYCMEGG